jgi:pentatricopeptide repeat protein
MPRYERSEKAYGYGYAEDGRRGGRSPLASPQNVATPLRGGRGGTPQGEKPVRNASALEELMRKRGVDEAWNALEEMQQQGNLTDKYTVSRMLMKTVGDNRSRLNPSRVYRVISLVEKFIEMQPKDVDEVLLNALLDTCCRLKDLNRLESIMQRMRDLNITPSPVTLGILVKTYGQAGNIEKVLQVWDEMEKQRGQANAVTYGCMIDACVKCNRLDKGIEIFKDMRETGKHRNTILYTTLIKGYGLEKDLKSAIELFREMPMEGVPYNTITYNSIIDACVKSGDLETAESLLREITLPGSGLEPDLITFSTLLKGYCQIADLDKALQVAEAIKGSGLRCDELVYNTLMDGCVKANDVTAGVGLFEEMVQCGLRPSAITHSILARLYQRAGYEEDASEAVAQLYQHHGIERPAGGDRGRGNGRKHRSPYASPTGSPHIGIGMHQDRGESWWNDNGMSGYDGYTDPSCASTPCSSPGHTIGNGGGGMFLPLDAVRGVPPLPGMGPETPYANSCASHTPMNSSFQGNFASSPCMAQMEQNQMQPGAFTQPGQMQSFAPGSFNQGTSVAAMSPTAMSSLPPFPMTGGQMPQTMQAPMDACTVLGLSSNCMQQPQSSPFPMPVSPPHDLPNGMCPTSQHPAFFESYTHNGQVNGANPFCL